ncbi:hypothetical protein CC80DRAFT_30386 [Byssothecium circinans]|uniref:Uncharacterized protein n=1 Tax=Byssothecium circinans TaxID=147558 RepID=A0A6A5U3J5_9PLEO|nr:hypothetical protein CC80DRAFT_30386 [Byssothecium circinans]
MARRSARLQKQRSPTPSDHDDSSNVSWETAQSQSPPHNDRLPSVVEDEEPAVETPRKVAVEKKAATTAKAQKTSKLPQLTMTTATPTQTPSRTPSNRTPIVPETQEMHPALHHASTAKMLDEARWLGFQNLGAHTAPPKATRPAAGQATPSKTTTATPNTPAAAKDSPTSGFQFRFRMKSPFSGLSPKSSSILKNRKDAAAADPRALFKADEFCAPADLEPKRKTAVPKGKMKRFSDIHMSQFKKMDSIANHPSAFRPVQLTNAPLKKSHSKVDLHKPELSAKTPNKLKRSQSKMDVTEPAPKAPASGLKRTQSKMEVTEQTTRIPPTPLKRTQSKMDLTGSSLPRSQSTVRLVPPSRDGRPTTQDGNPFAKRVKRTEVDDAATTRPLSRDGQPDANKPTVTKAATPARKITSQTALPRLASRLMTPTKASLMRSQSVKAVKTKSMLPSLVKSPSAANLFSPTNIGNAVKDSVREGIRKTSSSLLKVRSILRTPNRKFSNDLDKIAAGTHMSPPPGLDLQKTLPAAPQTAPAKKHVVFTNSTLERDLQDDWSKSPSPMKLRAGSEIPAGAVIYPSLRGAGNVEYPVLAEDNESGAASTSRRLTFGDATAISPGEFSFKSDKPIDFGPVSTGTIRMVRKSNASSMFDGKKRKLDTVEESSDKENSAPVQPDEGRSAKKAKTAPEPPKTPSKLPRRTPNKRGSSISKSRLAFLSTPKRGKA